MRIDATRTVVPCNGCTLCCQGDLIRLAPGESAEVYQTTPHPFIAGARVLDHKPNGDCMYLEDTGCRIHDRAPSLCRSADCRIIASHFDFETARRLHALHLIDIRVWDHGRMLLEQASSPRQSPDDQGAPSDTGLLEGSPALPSGTEGCVGGTIGGSLPGDDSRVRTGTMNGEAKV